MRAKKRAQGGHQIQSRIKDPDDRRTGCRAGGTWQESRSEAELGLKSLSADVDVDRATFARLLLARGRGGKRPQPWASWAPAGRGECEKGVARAAATSRDPPSLRRWRTARERRCRLGEEAASSSTFSLLRGLSQRPILLAKRQRQHLLEPPGTARRSNEIASPLACDFAFHFDTEIFFSRQSDAALAVEELTKRGAETTH